VFLHHGGVAFNSEGRAPVEPFGPTCAGRLSTTRHDSWLQTREEAQGLPVGGLLVLVHDVSFTMLGWC